MTKVGESTEWVDVAHFPLYDLTQQYDVRRAPVSTLPSSSEILRWNSGGSSKAEYARLH